MNRTQPYNYRLLAEWIKETGLTDEQFAAKVGCKRLTIYRVKTGRNWSLEILGKCAAACGKNLADILSPELAKNFGILVSST